MTPYYEDGSVTIYHGDCREVDAWDIAGAFMVTDPPYGMAFVNGGSRAFGWKSPWKGVAIAGDSDLDVRDFVLERWAPRPALVFGTWKTASPAGVRETLVWDKTVSTGMGALDIPWRPSWESIYVIGAGFVGARSHGVLRYSLPTLAIERQWHPTAKPVALMRELVLACAPLAEIVDPFMGSGTTLRAAKDLGRKAIGVEISEAYCETAANRMAQEVLAL